MDNKKWCWHAVKKWINNSQPNKLVKYEFKKKIFLWIFPQTAIPPVIMNALEKKAFMKVRNHKHSFQASVWEDVF